MGVGGFRQSPLLPNAVGIEHLTILVDNDCADKNGRCVGQDCANACTRTWVTAGCTVEQLIPYKLGDDFADIVKTDEARQ
jgi:hypothetical protein